MQRKQIAEDTIQKVFKELQKRFYKKAEKKGMMGFIDMVHGLGKQTEEYHECLWAVHSKDPDEYIDECYDLAITSLFSIASIIQ